MSLKTLLWFILKSHIKNDTLKLLLINNEFKLETIALFDTGDDLNYIQEGLSLQNTIREP